LCSWPFCSGALQWWKARRSSNCALHLHFPCRWWCHWSLEILSRPWFPCVPAGAQLGYTDWNNSVVSQFTR
jgi:hypothetical protein